VSDSTGDRDAVGLVPQGTVVRGRAGMRGTGTMPSMVQSKAPLYLNTGPEEDVAILS